MGTKFMVGLLAGFVVATESVAFAQDDLDEPKATEASGRKNARDFENEVVREVVRGYYLKADIGSTIYMNTHGVVTPSGNSLLSGVMSLSLGLGGEFIDKERFSAAWELQFGQGLFNGPRSEELQLMAGSPIEGDIHTMTGTAVLEFSTYFTRRFGLGGRIGGGVLYAPLLMGRTRYEEDIVSVWGAPARLHEGPAPMIVFGPTIEYYTKLSHFSVGVDVDVTYVIGFDLGVAPLGYLKYTF
ncbi:MAG: adventurous gliding motility protein CglE [Myxococcota bacterium]